MPAAIASAGWRSRKVLPSSGDLAGLDGADAGDALEKLLLALSLQRRDAENLARPQAERHAIEHPAGQVPHFERRRGVARQTRRDLFADRRRPGALDLAAEHQRDDLVLAAGRRLRHADDDAVAQHRGAVAMRGDLRHAVRNENDRPAAFAPVTHHLEDPLGEIARQRGGDLVEHQDLGIGGERASQIDQPQDGIGQVAHEGRKRHVGETERLHPAAHFGNRHRREAHVVENRQIGNKRRVLIDRHDAVKARLLGRAKRPRRAADRDGPAVRREHAGENLHQGALARPVGAHQCVNLAGAHAHRRRSQRDDRAETLAHVANFEKIFLRGHQVARFADISPDQLLNLESLTPPDARNGSPSPRPLRRPPDLRLVPRRAPGGASRRGIVSKRRARSAPKRRVDHSPGPLHAFSWAAVKCP